MKLFGYSISLNILILIGILYLIMVVNALSSSCNREGMTTTEAAAIDIINQIVDIMNQTITSSPNPLPRDNFMAYIDRVNMAMIKAKSTLVTEKAIIAMDLIKKAMETADYQRETYARQAVEAQQAVLDRQAEADRQSALDRQAEADRQSALDRQAEADRQSVLDRQAALIPPASSIRPAEPQRARKRYGRR